MKPLTHALAFVVAMILALVVANACTATSCHTDLDCDRGAFCIFRIGSCTQVGECTAEPSVPDDDPSSCATSAICGCPGPKAYTGCGYPNDYASSPTTGTDDLSLCTDAGPGDAGANAVGSGASDAGADGGAD